jgi:two-component system nitrogen regulation sensor histidine kinase GlnL
VSAVTQQQKTMDFSTTDFTDQLSTAILVLDSQLQVQYFNTASSAMFGVGENDWHNSISLPCFSTQI